jgi:superfamily II DNA or RNA helicase
MKNNGLTYEAFIQSKRVAHRPAGFDVRPEDLNPQMFDFQRFVTAWALKLGRAAVWADCGLGKTFIELEFARIVSERTGGKVLILAPLAVTAQTIAEGRKFGIEVYHHTKDGMIGAVRVLRIRSSSRVNSVRFT